MIDYEGQDYRADVIELASRRRIAAERIVLIKPPAEVIPFPINKEGEPYDRPDQTA